MLAVEVAVKAVPVVLADKAVQEVLVELVNTKVM
jgi:hypothetical protein